jgi:hypothetical protein
MLLLSVLQNYFLWHYTRAFKEMFHVWLNVLWFVIHFFSLPQLIHAWIAPFKRITERRQPGFNLEDWAGYLVINVMSRLVGALLRTVIILIGLIFLTGSIMAGAVVYLLWVFMPLLLIGGLVSSISILFLSV